MTLHERENRPHLGEGEGRLNVSDDNLDTVDCTDNRPRCVRCGHVVFTAPAILTGLGRDCRRIVVRAAREVVA